MLGLLLLLPPLASCAVSAPKPLQSTALDLGIPVAAMNSPITGTLADNTELHVRITFKIDPNALQKMQNQKIEPGKKSDLESSANRIGISDSTYQKIKNFFSPSAIALKLSKLHTQLSVDAKAHTLAKVLQTSFVVHNYQGHTFFAPKTAPKVPKFLADSIDAITGLDNYSSKPQHAFTMQFKTPASKQIPTQNCQPLQNTLLPRDVAGAYGYDQLWQRGLNGENMTVNLVEIDGSYRTDVQNYLDCIQFKGHFSVVNVDGKPTDALGESTLDIQMVAGLARSVNIVAYQTDGNASNDVWTNVNDMLQQIADDNVNNASSGNVVSISLGAAEQELSSNDMQAIDSSLQQLTRAEHMTVFVASGDCGAFTTRQYGDLSVSFPASDPWSTSVGGTILQVNGNRSRTNEIAWSDGSNQSTCKNQWGSGGGNSAAFQHPNWQNAPGVQNNYSRGMRQLPDISAVAYDLAVYFKGRWGAVGGTSAAAPIWAAGLALVNEGMIQQVHTFSYGPQLFYAVANRSNGAQPYYDVTRGNNLYYPAGPGWDFATGLGTPNLPDFYQIMGSVS
ncbi:MAG: S53 family serine peptidase [Ktedonobacteraceae bacterium]